MDRSNPPIIRVRTLAGCICAGFPTPSTGATTIVRFVLTNVVALVSWERIENAHHARQPLILQSGDLTTAERAARLRV